MKSIFRTLSLPVFLVLVFSISTYSVYADESWELVFTARDTASYYSSAYCGENLLYIYLDTGTSNISLGGTPWDASCDYQYGKRTIDFTSEYVPGSRIIFKLTKKINSKDVFLLYDLDILHNGNPVRFSPWIPGGRGNSENGGVLAKELEDDWLNLGVRSPSSRGDYATLTSQPLADAPELVINQSDLKFNKPIYDFGEGDDIQVSVNVHNIGGVDENNAQVSLYLNGVLDQTIDAGTIECGGNKTINFNKIINFGSSNVLEVKAVVTSSDPDLEGKEDNNRAVKYIIKDRPYLFFNDVTNTYGYNHQSDEPYASWISSLKSSATSCLANDYSSSSLSESTKASCALKMAAYYTLDNSRIEYADKAGEALLHIGDSSSFTWVNRGMAGDAPPNTGNTVVSSDQNYGLSGCDGNTYRGMLYYGIAYNWVHNWVRDNKEEDLVDIRDNLAKLGAHLYLMNREIYSYGDELSGGRGTSLFECGDYGEGKIEILSALGVIALSILDYDGQYDDLDGNPHEWVRFTEQDFLNESQSGAYLPILRQMQSEDGMYQEGGGYRTYYSDAEFYFYSTYKDTFNNNPSLSDKYNLARTAMTYLPYTVQPNGAYPNYCVSYTKKRQSEYTALNSFEPGTTERKIINMYINKTLMPNQGLSTSGMANYEKIFTYDKTESYDETDATWTSPNKLMHVFRSGWDRNALYSFVKSHNEPAMSGHQPYQNDQLTFDIFAKGAYLIVDAGNERFLDQIGGSDSGHTAFLVYTDGAYRPCPKLTKGQYGDTCQNPSYIRETLDTDHLDFMQGDMHVTQAYSWPSWHAVDNVFTFTRAMIMVDGDYIISFDKLNSSVSNNYKLTIPFGSADGHIGDSLDYDNWALGNLTIDKTSYEWYNYDNPDDSNWKIEQNLTKVNEIIWKSKSDIDNLNPVSHDVNMTVFLNPHADIEIRHFGMHYGTYGVNHEWVAPVINVKRSGVDVKQLNTYYPTNSTDPTPTFEQLTVTGGTGDDYATKITTTEAEDIALMSDGELVTAGEMQTDGKIAFVRNRGGLDYFFCRECSEFSYNEVGIIDMSVGVDYLLMDVEGANRTFKIKNDEVVDMTLTVQSGFNYIVRKNGQTYGDWSTIDNEHIQIHVTSPDEAGYEIIATSGVDNTPPGSITGLGETATGSTWITWTWNNPPDLDYHHAKTYLNEEFYEDITAPGNTVTATDLTEGNTYTLSVRTVDSTGNTNPEYISNEATAIQSITTTTGTTTTTTGTGTTTTSSRMTTTTKKKGGGSSGGGGGGGGGGSSGGRVSIQEETCFDGILNQGEKGIDCGGPCQPCPSCSDKIQNQGESGIDCGGPCSPCPSCFDGIENQGEEGVDCGGVCAPCMSCRDGIQNQGESGIDCGGPCTPCKETTPIIRLEEKAGMTLTFPDKVLAGDKYTATATLRNTGDLTIKDLTIKLGDKEKKIDLDLGDTVTLDFDLTAPEGRGEYIYTAQAYTDRLFIEKKTELQVESNPLTLRTQQQGEYLNITVNSNLRDSVITLEVYKGNKIVYQDLIEVREKEVSRKIKADKDYTIKATLRKGNQVIQSREIKPETEKEFNPTNIDPIILTPIALIDLYLLTNILGALGLRKVIR